MSLPVERRLFYEIAMPPCCNVGLGHLSQVHTLASRHAPFSAFGGTRNNRIGKWNHALNGNWSFRIVWIEGMNVPFSLTNPEFGYNRLFGKVMAAREKRNNATRLWFGNLARREL